MMSNRRFSAMRGLTALVFVLGFSAVSASAQARLEPGFFANESLWSPQERDVAVAFVAEQLSAIQDGDASAVSAGRKNLVDALTTTGAAERFVEQFSGVITERIGPLAAAEGLSTRINAMIICTHLRHPDALAPVQSGLTDANAGVRFAAAQAANNLLAADQLVDNRREQLLKQIEDLVVAENEIYVVAPLFSALQQAEDNARVLEALNRRAAWHVVNPMASYEPERTALQDVFSEFFVAPAAQRVAADIKELARASARYTSLAADQLVNHESPNANVTRSRTDMILVAASSLNFAHTELRVRQPAPIANPERLIQQEAWPALIELSNEWREILKADPVSLSDQDLAVAAPAPAE